MLCFYPHFISTFKKSKVLSYFNHQMAVYDHFDSRTFHEYWFKFTNFKSLFIFIIHSAFSFRDENSIKKYYRTPFR